MPTPIIIIGSFVLAAGVVILAAFVYLYQAAGAKNGVSRDTWRDFVNNLHQLKQRDRKIGILVSSDKKALDLAQRVEERILPAFEFAVDSVVHTDAIRLLEMNTPRDQMPPNCHVVVVITCAIRNDNYIVTFTYYSSNAIGQRTSEPLRYRPDELRLSYAEWNKLKRRDALRHNFRKMFSSFIAAVARKMD
ncbi:MAG: hypothetical protein AB1656_02450 [Candidatus Omnitrophota bacterium]